MRPRKDKGLRLQTHVAFFDEFSSEAGANLVTENYEKWPFCVDVLVCVGNFARSECCTCEIAQYLLARCRNLYDCFKLDQITPRKPPDHAGAAIEIPQPDLTIWERRRIGSRDCRLSDPLAKAAHSRKVAGTMSDLALTSAALTRVLLGLSAVLMLGAAIGPGQFLREQRTVTVNRRPEQWQLVWHGRPKPICAPEEVEMAVTCPCTGFAYGEMGKLSLVRKRGGKEVERLALGPYFEDLPASNSRGLAAMQWRPMEPRDFDEATDIGPSPGFIAAVGKRRGPRVMQMADYDKDGNASEFLVQVSAGPCGHTAYMLFGVSKVRPRLHAFGTSDHPGDVLTLPGSAWQALLTTRGTAKVTAWPCGDHGSDVRQELLLSAKGGAIRVRRKTWSCPENGEGERLIGEAVL